MRTNRWALLAAIPGLVVVGCTRDDDEMAALEEEIVEVRAAHDRDRISQLEGDIASGTARHERALETQARVADIIADPGAWGTEDEVLDLLDEYAAEGSTMEGTAPGEVGMRAAWRNTLFGDVDAVITTWTTWMADDGSTGGSLWTWSGTAANGEPFELIGIGLSTYDDDGRITHVRVDWPYPADDVRQAFAEGNR